VLRAAVSPATTATHTTLLQQIVSAVVLGSVGAGARLLQQGLALNFGSSASILVPALVVDGTSGKFVGEGAPIPVYAPSIGTPTTLTPKTIKVIWALTNELIEGSNAEAVVNELMRRNVGLSLDVHLFDNVAADTVRPAGLRNSVAATTASVLTDPHAAMLADISALLTAVAPVGGPVTLIASPARAGTIPLLARGGTVPVLASSAVAAADLIAVATDGLASALSSIVADASQESMIHMSDTPLAIGTA